MMASNAPAPATVTMTTKHVLMLEDDTALCAVVQEFLSLHEYTVHVCHDGRAFIQALKLRPYDLVLLDLNLPDADGLDLLADLRAGNTTLLYVISGRSDQGSRIRALELGADDFINKPFSIRELELKIRNALMRSARPKAHTLDSAPSDHPCGDVTLSARDRSLVAQNGDSVSLTRGEFELVNHLVKANGNVVSRDALLGYLSHNANVVSYESITTLIYRLRVKFRRLGVDCPIVTVAREGYKIKT